MQTLFPKMGIQFEVWYLAWREPNREWEIDLNAMNYSYRVFKGLHPVIGSMYAHFNPGMITKLLFYRFDMVIIGGMGSPSHWLAPFVIRKSKLKIFSSETNLFSTSIKRGIALWFKRFIINQYKHYQVTGEASIKYIKWVKKSSKDISSILLPNVVDSRVFNSEVNELRKSLSALRKELNLPMDKRLWLCPARLESVKGQLNFLSYIKELQGVKLILLGSGTEKEEIQSFIKSNSIAAEIRDFVQQEQMVKYYAVCDVFVLPSLKDPSPLSPIEALAARLPLLISNRIDNYADVLKEGQNGFGFNPLKEEEVKYAVNEMVRLSDTKRKEFGASSFSIFQEKFDEEKCIISFGKQLLELYNREKS